MPTTTTTVTKTVGGTTRTETTTETIPDAVTTQPALGKATVHYWRGRGRAEVQKYSCPVPHTCAAHVCRTSFWLKLPASAFRFPSFEQCLSSDVSRFAHSRPFRCPAQPIRCLLAAGGATFDNSDESLKQENHQTFTSSQCTYGQVPMVEVDGMQLIQQLPTLRFLAKKLGMWPDDPKDEYVVDHVLEAVFSVREQGPMFMDPHPDRWGILLYPFPAAMGGGDGGTGGDISYVLDKWMTPTGMIGRYCPAWEKILTEKAQDGPFLLGAQVLGTTAITELE